MSAEPSSAAMLFNPFDPQTIADPYPGYRRLREAAPVWRSPIGSWVLTRHADIAAVLKDQRFGHDFEGEVSPRRSPTSLDEPVLASLRLTMLVRDPPDHTRLRNLVVRAFTARRVEEMRPRIEGVVDALIDAVADAGRMDVIADFAHQLPVIVICDMLGVPEEDRGLFLGSFRITGRAVDPNPMTAAELETSNAHVEMMRDYWESLFARRQADPGDDLVSGLLAVRDEADGRLSHDELAANIGLLFAAGHETTANLIGNGLVALHRSGTQWQRLVAEPGLAAGAVDELLRFDPSVQLTARKALENADVAGEPIARGDHVICLIGAANRDPSVYPDPDALDITRRPARPIAFGGGIHHCLGAQLARIEGEIAVRRLAERLPEMRLELDDLAWRPTITLRGLTRLEASWPAGSA